MGEKTEAELLRLANELELQLDTVRDEIERRRRAELPRARISDTYRPLYLAGCSGTVGGYSSAERRYFYPDAGTDARARSSEWRVHVSAIEFEGADEAA